MQTRIASSSDRDATRAVAEVAALLLDDERAPAFTLFFCSPSYDLDQLAAEIKRQFGDAVAGCTSAGQIDDTGFTSHTLSAVSIFCDALDVESVLIENIQAHDCHARVERLIGEMSPVDVGRNAVGLLLIDGLSLGEEAVSASIHAACGSLPFIGGSAGDDLRFEDTRVYHSGRFLKSAAVFTRIATELPIVVVKSQHYEASDKRMLVTRATAENRTVQEINGLPAVVAYAEMVGVAPDALGPSVFSANPIILRIHDEPYVRSIQRANADGSLTFMCAIDEGIVMSIGHRLDPQDSLRKALDLVEAEIGKPALILACDCILRRLEFNNSHADVEMGRLLAENNVFGFSTYGEQHNGLHINQTFTGIAFGAG